VGTEREEVADSLAEVAVEEDSLGVEGEVRVDMMGTGSQGCMKVSCKQDLQDKAQVRCMGERTGAVDLVDHHKGSDAGVVEVLGALDDLGDLEGRVDVRLGHRFLEADVAQNGEVKVDHSGQSGSLVAEEVVVVLA